VDLWLCQAVTHKEYTRQTAIQISVYPDRLMIWNPGHLPEHWSLEKLLGKHASEPQNPNLANAFFKCAYLESWGRGIDLIREACAEQGTPAPAFRWDGGLWVEFPFGAEHILAESLPGQAHHPTAQESKLPDGGLGEKLGEKLGQTSAAILVLMLSHPKITIRKLAGQLGLSTTAIEKNIDKLKKAGLIQRIGPAKGGYWLVTPDAEANPRKLNE